MGYKLESSRIDKINKWYLESEMELLDQKIQSDAFEFLGLDCGTMIKENIKFADRIFEKALEIDQYEKANRINREIISQHKRYDYCQWICKSIITYSQCLHWAQTYKNNSIIQ